VVTLEHDFVKSKSNILCLEDENSKPQQLRRRRAPPTIVSFDDDICTPMSSTPPANEVPSSSAPPTCLNSPISPQPPSNQRWSYKKLLTCCSNLFWPRLPEVQDGNKSAAGATLTPVSNAAVGELIPVFPNGNIITAATDEEDSISVPSYSEVCISFFCHRNSLLKLQILLKTWEK